MGRAVTGTGVERTRVAVAGLRLAECGTNGAGSLTTGRPCGPTFAQINRGPDSQWWRTGQAEWRVAPGGPTFMHRYIGQTAGSKADQATQGSSVGK